MAEKQVEYRRKVSSIRSWTDFSARHVAFALHRITGWLLLGWVVLHLGLPTVSGESTVWNPLFELGGSAAEVVIIGLLAVLVFHSFNGIRLIAAELFGLGIATARTVFILTLVISVVLVIGMGVML